MLTVANDLHQQYMTPYCRYLVSTSWSADQALKLAGTLAPDTAPEMSTRFTIVDCFAIAKPFAIASNHDQQCSGLI